MATSKNRRRELLVAGYVRNLETLLTINVPIEITDIIYLYQRLLDTWNRKYSHKDITIDENAGIMKINVAEHVTAYGTLVVSKGVFKWKIKILSTDEGTNAPSWIGIVEDDESLLQRYYNNSNWDHNGCQLCGGSGSLYSKQVGIIKNAMNYNCRWSEQGDVLEMTLDLDQQKLSFVVNGEDFGVRFENVKLSKYRIAWTSFCAKNAEFMFLD